MSASVEATGFTVDAKGTLPLNESFGVFGKIGILFWDAEASASAGGASASLNDDGADLTFGIGAEYSFTEQFGVRGEWERFDFDGDDVDLLSIGAVMKF